MCLVRVLCGLSWHWPRVLLPHSNLSLTLIDTCTISVTVWMAIVAIWIGWYGRESILALYLTLQLSEEHCLLLLYVLLIWCILALVLLSHLLLQ